MDITYSHKFAAPLTRVLQMLQNEEFLRARGESAWASESEVLLDTDTDGGFIVTIRRQVNTETIPVEFRSFVPATLSVLYTEVWTAPEPNMASKERVGTWAVDIAGAPGHGSGSLLLKTAGENACALGLAGTVTVSIPLLGGPIERAIGGAINDAIPREFELADEWLARVEG